MGALTEDRTESGTYSKSTKGHYLFGLFGVIFLQICYHFLAMILQKTTLNFKMIQVSSVLCWVYWPYYVTDFLICSFLQMSIVDKYATSWGQEIKSQTVSGLKRFSPSSDWQIEEFKGTCYGKKESDLPTESICHVVLRVIFIHEFMGWIIQLRASLCKILISSFVHKMDFAHNFSVDFF